MTRKVAVNRVIKGDISINRCIVEIENGFVVDYYHFDDEQPFTEWLGGTIEIITSNNDNSLRAIRNGEVLK